MIEATIVRLVWSVIEELRSSELLQLSDAALITFLLQQIARRVFLNCEETRRLQSYLSSKLSLIRDLAEG